MKRPLLAVAVAALLPAAAEAQVTQLVFEELLDGEFIADYYDGGCGSAGTGPGPADGVAFASNARVQRTGNYQGNPTPPGIMTWATGTSTFHPRRTSLV